VHGPRGKDARPAEDVMLDGGLRHRAN